MKGSGTAETSQNRPYIALDALNFERKGKFAMKKSLLILSLTTLAAVAQVPTGKFTYVFTNLPLWDFTGTYQGSVDGGTYTEVVAQQANGKITGTSSETIFVDGDAFQATGNVLGSISLINQAVGIQYTWKNGTFSGAGLSGTATVKGTAVVAPSSLSIENNFTGRFCDRGRCRTLSLSEEGALPSGMNGDWNLALDLTSAGTGFGGSAVLTLSNARTFSYSVGGHYNAKLEMAVLSLTGQGDAKGTFLSITANGTNLAPTKVSGSILGQKLKFSQ